MIHSNYSILYISPYSGLPSLPSVIALAPTPRSVSGLDLSMIQASINASVCARRVSELAALTMTEAQANKDTLSDLSDDEDVCVGMLTETESVFKNEVCFLVFYNLF